MPDNLAMVELVHEHAHGFNPFGSILSISAIYMGPNGLIFMPSWYHSVKRRFRSNNRILNVLRLKPTDTAIRIEDASFCWGSKRPVLQRSVSFLVMKENKGTVWFASKYFISINSEKNLLYGKFTIDIKESI